MSECWFSLGSVHFYMHAHFETGMGVWIRFWKYAPGTQCIDLWIPFVWIHTKIWRSTK